MISGEGRADSLSMEIYCMDCAAAVAARFARPMPDGARVDVGVTPPKPAQPSIRLLVNLRYLLAREHVPGEALAYVGPGETLAAMLIMNRCWPMGRVSIGALDGHIVVQSDGSPVAVLPVEEWRRRVDAFARRAAGVAEDAPVPGEVLIEISAGAVPEVK